MLKNILLIIIPCIRRFHAFIQNAPVRDIKIYRRKSKIYTGRNFGRSHTLEWPYLKVSVNSQAPIAAFLPVLDFRP